jgi:hypothetical protein
MSEGTLREAWFAGTAAMLLCVPHVLSYDWVLLFVPGAAVYLERRSIRFLAMLIVLHVLANFSEYQPGFFPGHGILDGVFVVPWLALIVVYLAFRGTIDDWIDSKLPNRLRAVDASATPASA